MPSAKVLIVDDSEPWTELITIWLNQAGFHELYRARSGSDALELVRKTQPDCILLDLVLPDMDGMELCKLIRSIPALAKTPIVMITAHRKDKIMGLDLGADYFVQKTGNPTELMATIRAVFRRRDLDQDIFRSGDLVLNLSTRKVFFRELPVATLTPKTFELFYVLLERSPEPVQKDLLFKAVEGKQMPELSRALDILVNRLRRLLPNVVQRRIRAVKGFGYVYIAPQQGAPPAKRPGARTPPAQ